MHRLDMLLGELIVFLVEYYVFDRTGRSIVSLSKNDTIVNPT
jgi:hypothetical protein